MKHDPKDLPKSFCVLPWMHRFTNIGGEIQVCCTSEEQDNNVRGPKGKMKAPRNFSNEEIMNSDFMKRLRTKMLNGEWPQLCDRCLVTEKSGGESRRVVENRAHAEWIPQFLETTGDDGTLQDVKVISFDIRLGNTCNLACRMCSPRSSSRWAREWTKVDQRQLASDPVIMESYKHYDWYKAPEVLAEFKKQIPHLRHVHFAGGEPLIVPEMLKFLEACVESGHSKNIEISYNTNITVLPKEVKTLWPQFRAVKLLCSIDGFGKLNEFIRHPSKWSDVDRNLRDLDLHFKEYGLSEVLVMCTAQVYNIFRLRELYDYLAENFSNISKLPHLIDLHYPIFYRHQILPEKLKLLAEERINDLLAVSQKRIADGIIPASSACRLDTLRATVNFMKMGNCERFVEQFRRAAESKDKIRGQDVYAVLPELEPLRDIALNPIWDLIRRKEALDVR